MISPGRKNSWDAYKAVKYINYSSFLTTKVGLLCSVKQD